MACVEKISCPKCGGDNLQVFEKDGEYTGYCFGINKKTGRPCSTYYADPYQGNAPKTPKSARTARSEAEVGEDLDYVSALPEASLPGRKLLPWSLAHFGVRMEVSEEDGTTPTVAFYPFHSGQKLAAYKAKHISPKKIWVMGDFSNVDMFGWNQAIATGSPKLFITEGEEDAVALYQAIKESQAGGKWEHLQPAVCSLPAGASSVKRALSKHLQDIRQQFKEVVFVFDQDEAGRAAVKEGLSILPSAQSVTLPAKDANQCLIEGRSKALVQACLWKSATPKNTRIINASSLYNSAREQATYGLSYPWPKITELTRGIRFGETIYIGAGVKMGKSEVVNSLAKHLIIDHNLPVFLAKPEEANRKTIQMVLGKVAGKVFHDPKVEFDYEAYDKAAEAVGDKLRLLSLYQHMGWQSLRDDIIQAAGDGCKAVFIDPITNLVNGTSAGETDTVLKEIAQELAALAMDLNIVIFIFCHLKSPGSGEPHERGGKINSNQFAGSRAMMRSCNYMMGLEGNKDPDLPPEQRNIRELIILEDREFGEVGSQKLYWDYMSGLFNPIEGD